MDRMEQTPPTAHHPVRRGLQTGDGETDGTVALPAANIILYCETCGYRIHRKDLETGRAVSVDPMVAYCPECRPDDATAEMTAPPEPKDPTPETTKCPSKRIPKRKSGPLPQTETRRPTWPYGILIACGGVAGFLLVFFLMRRDHSQISPRPHQRTRFRPVSASVVSATSAPQKPTAPAPRAAPATIPNPQAARGADARKALEVADAYLAGNPTDGKGAIAKYRQIIDSFAGTGAAYNAEMRIVRLENRQVNAGAALPPKQPPPSKPEPAPKEEPVASLPVQATATLQPERPQAAVDSVLTYDRAVKLAAGAEPLDVLDTKISLVIASPPANEDARWRDYLRKALGSTSGNHARIAALALLRGRPESAREQFGVLHIPWRAEYKTILQRRRIAMRDQSVSRSTPVSAPSIPTRRVKNLKGMFLGDVKRLPDGRVSLTYDPERPEHGYDFVDRGLAARFTEIEVEIHLVNDGRWHRVFHLGDTVLYHHHRGGQSIEHLDKKHKHAHALPTGKSSAAHGGGAARRYRLKAGPRGISFQVDGGPRQTVAGPWLGGRLMWPGHNVVLPTRLRVTGRLDPEWLSEMAPIAKDRVRFLSGAPVKLKPQERPARGPELAPWLHNYAYGRDPETYVLSGWHEVGAAWTVSGKEWVSPNPSDGRERWVSWIRPAALIARDAVLSFEAKIEKGHLDVFVPSHYGNNRHRTNTEYLAIDTGGVAFVGLHTFGSRPDMRKVGRTIAQTRRASPSTRWHRYRVTLAKGAVSLAVDGAQALQCKVGPSDRGAMAFYVYSGSSVRLRNVRIRKLVTGK